MGYGSSKRTALAHLFNTIVEVRGIKECEPSEKIFLETAPEMEAPNRKRGHATGFNAPRKYKSCEEVLSVRCWAKEMNKYGCRIHLNTIRKNPDAYPDCLAMMGGLRKIGIEVTELVDRAAIRAHPEIPPYQGPEHFLDNLEKFQEPLPPIWTLEKFEQNLRDIVRRKDLRGKESSLSRQVLLIVTDEPWLDGNTLEEYLDAIELARPCCFDGVYMMRDYVPDGDGHGHYPVSKVSLAD